MSWEVYYTMRYSISEFLLENGFSVHLWVIMKCYSWLIPVMFKVCVIIVGSLSHLCWWTLLKDVCLGCYVPVEVILHSWDFQVWINKWSHSELPKRVYMLFSVQKTQQAVRKYFYDTCQGRKTSTLSYKSAAFLQ